MLSKKDGVYNVRCWDLDHLSECNEWQLFTRIPEEVKAKMGDMNLKADQLSALISLTALWGMDETAS
ncbi:hypothetical protein [Cytobacillus firmus]|uniref:Uncharacterized protein n=1 Tax=Cytobacillus firmus TaxID=1399 RepID=A0AA46P5G5_CYTFI|nr:hypothetical protein [Cytobacillus firmus]UYG95329.1 hypothetical protein OD459_24650 [Cytobacillus firmus]